MHLRPRTPDPNAYVLEIDLLLAAGQVLLRSTTREYEFHGPMEIHRVIQCHPDAVARYGGVSVEAVKAAFPPPGSSPVPRWRRRLSSFFRREFVLPPEKLCLSVVRGLLEAHPRLFARQGIGHEDLREAQLFSVMAAAMVLEGEEELEVRIGDFMRLWGTPLHSWSQAVHNLLKATRVFRPPFCVRLLETGQTEFDYRFRPNPQSLRTLGFPPPAPPAPLKPPEEKPAPPPAPARKANKEEEPQVCTFEETASLPGLSSLVVSPDVMEDLQYVLALCNQVPTTPEVPPKAHGCPRGALRRPPKETPGPAPRLLFHGPPGTGKTHAARALAHELRRPLAHVPPGSLYQKWLGETEKAIERAFREAAEQGALLFLDEADSFLHDRRKAIQSHELSSVNALLNQLDRALVPVILCTNLLDSLDAAVHRRIDHLIEFPVPVEAQRRELWQKEVNRARLWRENPDCSRLAKVPLSGGLIHNAVTQAARRRLVHGAAFAVNTETLLALAQKELPKMGDCTRGREPIGFRALAEKEETAPRTHERRRLFEREVG